MYIPTLLVMILLGLILYVPNWGWKTIEVKEIGKILFFCGVLALAFQFRAGRLL
jgi:uncharacterized membrane protein